MLNVLGSVTITTRSRTDRATTCLDEFIYIRRTYDYIKLNVHQCVLFSSVRVRIRVRLRFSVCLISCYAHVFERLRL